MDYLELEEEIFLEDFLDTLEINNFGFRKRIYERSNYFDDFDELSFFRRIRLLKGTGITSGNNRRSSREYPHDLFVAFTNRHPIIRGMLSYGTIWPISCIIQQTIAGKTWENYDWIHALRFSLYGGLFTAPTLYGWIRLSSAVWPKSTLKTSVTKAMVEQFTYGPFALICFFFGMSILEGKSIQEAETQVKDKLFPTWKVGICVWPAIQTLNFCYIPEKNRVPFVSACSLVWCCFLAYMHELQLKQKQLEPSLLKTS